METPKYLLFDFESMQIPQPETIRNAFRCTYTNLGMHSFFEALIRIQNHVKNIHLDASAGTSMPEKSQNYSALTYATMLFLKFFFQGKLEIEWDFKYIFETDEEVKISGPRDVHKQIRLKKIFEGYEDEKFECISKISDEYTSFLKTVNYNLAEMRLDAVVPQVDSSGNINGIPVLKKNKLDKSALMYNELAGIECYPLIGCNDVNEAIFLFEDVFKHRPLELYKERFKISNGEWCEIELKVFSSENSKFMCALSGSEILSLPINSDFVYYIKCFIPIWRKEFCSCIDGLFLLFLYSHGISFFENSIFTKMSSNCVFSIYRKYAAKKFAVAMNNIMHLVIKKSSVDNFLDELSSDVLYTYIRQPMNPFVIRKNIEDCRNRAELTRARLKEVLNAWSSADDTAFGAPEKHYKKIINIWCTVGGKAAEQIVTTFFPDELCQDKDKDKQIKAIFAKHRRKINEFAKRNNLPEMPSRKTRK